jgi:4-hydroxybenzoate polyprenyltransferase
LAESVEYAEAKRLTLICSAQASIMTSASHLVSSESFPLVVDLDGTLILTDMLHESGLRLLRDKPWQMALLPIWLLRGKAHFKRQIALNAAAADPATLPFNLALLDWLKQQKALGRYLVLCTASDALLVKPIAEHLGLFDEVLSSTGEVNLAGEFKAEALVKRFGLQGFDYAGNAEPDLKVWAVARHAIVVNAADKLLQKAQTTSSVKQIFPGDKTKPLLWLKMLRVHQWLKNLLLFVPIFAAHQLMNQTIWSSLMLAFVAFSLCASSVYIANDLLDLESDRLHPRKRLRPFASGQVPIALGVCLAPILFVLSLVIAQQVGHAFVYCLLLYFGVTCAYSWGLKRVMLLDCLTLAWLYTLRIVSGTVAASLTFSFWLLAFSVFLFLSLAFVKRYAELNTQLLAGNHKAHGRGYLTSDAPMIQTMGIVSGYVAVLVLSLYFNSDVVVQLYRTPEFLWGAVPVMLFWISWMWMQAHRGHMHDDPLIFAVKDKGSLAAGVVFVLVLMLGAARLPW